MFNYSQINNFEYGCASRGTCSVSPNVGAIKSLMIALLAQIAFCMLKLDDIEENYALELLEIIANLDTTDDFSEAQILSIFLKQYSNYKQIKDKYLKTSDYVRLPSNKIILKDDFTISDLIKSGQKLITKLRKNITTEVKYLREIFLNILKSTCINYLVLSEYKSYPEYTKTIIECFSRAINRKQSFSSLKNIVIKLAELNSEIMRETYNNMSDNFGKMSITKVSSSSEKNKAILVGGDDLIELIKVLENSKDENIDVYTNGNMLIAHAFERFKNYPHLKAHFGNSQESMMLDFATFPGSILLTKRGVQKMEYFYRGRLFSSDELVPKGIKSADKDYKNLIDSAKLAKGFVKGQKRPELEVGYDIATFEKKLETIKNDFDAKKYKKLVIVGFGSQTTEEIDFFQSYLKELSNENFIISFSHKIPSKNILHINVANNYAILSEFLNLIFEKFKINSEHVEFILMKCDSNALSQIVSLKSAGAKNIYFSQCPPAVINPSVLELFKNTFDVKLLNIAI